MRSLRRRDPEGFDAAMRKASDDGAFDMSWADYWRYVCRRIRERRES